MKQGWFSVVRAGFTVALFATGALLSNCGRVSFYDQGEFGDAGLGRRDAGLNTTSSSSNGADAIEP